VTPHYRQVAIKVLKPELARSLGAERFLREIEIAARVAARSPGARTADVPRRRHSHDS